MGTARKVVRAYAAIFVVHATVEAKNAKRIDWLRQREEVTATLESLAHLYPRLSEAKEAWSKLELEEDSFVVNDTLNPPDNKVMAVALKRYELVHQEFLKKLSGLMVWSSQ